MNLWWALNPKKKAAQRARNAQYMRGLSPEKKRRNSQRNLKLLRSNPRRWAKAQMTKKRHRRRNWATQLLYTARANSKTRKHEPPTITVEWILAQPLQCPYTGTALVPSSDDLTRNFRPNAPSLDRVDNDVGYTPENTRLVCYAWQNLRMTKTVDTAMQDLTDWLGDIIHRYQQYLQRAQAA